MQDFDVVIVGGGLAGCLSALALRARRPELSLALVEAGPRLGGNHTWCFHAGDVPEAAREFVEPLVAWRWPGYEVRFPDRARTLASPYAGTDGTRVAVHTERALGDGRAALFTDTRCDELQSQGVLLQGGRWLGARLVLDARGPGRLEARGRVAWQKFLGLEVVLQAPLAPRLPLLMDATVPQVDGFRFLYVLPLAPDRVLVEDTYFSDEPEMAREAWRRGLLEALLTRGLTPGEVVREEEGCLPLPWEPTAHTQGGSPLAIGYQGGFFHPTTGYSFPVALRVALAVAEDAPTCPGPALRALLSRHSRQQRFACLLNRLLFGALSPADRWNVLSRFYGLPEDVVRRFYALDSSAADRARILCGRPPHGISLRRALTQALTP